MATKTSKLKLNYKIWIETTDNQGVLGDGKWQLLKAVLQTGSLKDAIDNQGLSYRKTWNNLKKIQKRLGFPILKTTRGGADGGSTELTDEGIKIVQAFDNFHDEFDATIQKAFEKFNQNIEELINAKK